MLKIYDSQPILWLKIVLKIIFEYYDVCEVARQVHKQKPKLKIHTIIIGDEDNPATYIANITGGKVYKPQDTVELIKNMKEASGNFKKVCIE